MAVRKMSRMKSKRDKKDGKTELLLKVTIDIYNKKMKYGHV